MTGPSWAPYVGRDEALEFLSRHPRVARAVERLERTRRPRDAMRLLVLLWIDVARTVVGIRTCWITRHQPTRPLEIPGRGVWWACRCGLRLGGRVY